MSDEDPDKRLARLRDATSSVGPRRDFTARVMRGVTTDVSDWWGGLPRVARRVVPFAALAAVVAATLATTSTFAFDDALTSADDDAVEVEW